MEKVEKLEDQESSGKYGHLALLDVKKNVPNGSRMTCCFPHNRGDGGSSNGNVLIGARYHLDLWLQKAKVIECHNNQDKSNYFHGLADRWHMLHLWLYKAPRIG